MKLSMKLILMGKLLKQKNFKLIFCRKFNLLFMLFFFWVDLSAQIESNQSQNHRLHFDSLAVNDNGFFFNSIAFTGIAFANNKEGVLLREMDIVNGEILKHRNYYAYSTDTIPRIKFETEMKDGKKNGFRRGCTAPSLGRCAWAGEPLPRVVRELRGVYLRQRNPGFVFSGRY